MKTKILTLLFALVSVVAMGQKKVVWEELAVSYSPNPQLMITKVEFSKEKTTLYAAYQYPPDGWFRISGESYLQSEGKTYAIVGSDSIALDEECYTDKDTWLRKFVLYFWITGSVLMIIFQDRKSINGNVNETSNELQ